MVTSHDSEHVTLIADEPRLRAAAEALGRAAWIGLDIESNGLFKYKATLCTMQLATPDAVFVVDTKAVAPTALASVLGKTGPTKIVHDVAFDARILAESEIELGNVFDTSLAARMLGRLSTGLASLLESELGVKIDKKLQHHDWTERPLTREHLRYLAGDVAHLGALADRFRADLASRESAGAIGIAEAIGVETEYRLAQAIAAARQTDSRPPYLRLKGVDRLPKDELPILRRITDVREAKARALDVPPYKVIGPDVLLAIAKARPTTMAELARVRGATNGHRARSIAADLVAAVSVGIADGSIPDEHRQMLERPRLASAVVKERRARESRLTAWRKAEAKKRGVDEQVVLPGHCLQDLVDLAERASAETIVAVPGFGSFRSARDVAALLDVLTSTSTRAIAAQAEEAS